MFYHVTAQEAAERVKDWFPDADVILVEGYKTGPFPKVLVYRDGVSEKISPWPENIIAVAGDVEAAKRAGLSETLPVSAGVIPPPWLTFCSNNKP